MTVHADQLIEAAWKYDPDVSSLDELRALLLETAATLLRQRNLTCEGVSAVVGDADSDRTTAEGNVSRSASPMADFVPITKDDLRLLVALANTVEDVTDEEAAALNRARVRANPS